MHDFSLTIDCAKLSTSTTDALPTQSYALLGTPKVLDTLPTTTSEKTSLSPGPKSTRNQTIEGRSLVARDFSDDRSPNPAYMIRLSEMLTDYNGWIGDNGDITGVWKDYGLQAITMAGINGLHGCTAVVIISARGGYLSHIWEFPVFKDRRTKAPTPDDWFDAKVFGTFGNGDEYTQSIRSLIGDEANPGPLNKVNTPLVFVVTPYAIIPGVTVDLNNLPLLFPERASRLMNGLIKMIPGSAVGGILGYIALNKNEATSRSGYEGRLVLEFNPYEVWVEQSDAPPNTGRQYGRWRLWIAENLVAHQFFLLPYFMPRSLGVVHRRRSALSGTSPCPDECEVDG
ncbi:hypothetical protein N7492_007157 [Penicillium capsulatum]|uniref:Uncharacterized protein n=1 Tax=Penicillium capsulatum TaxID=69766 RepID=A0A9W9LL12_9EURO|nr:hypothetical protein N7492_007157 [Penicillium capsulatum]KAJ6116994.1 hypothetical protein N7512_006719 [Penicillium capsulatum]